MRIFLIWADESPEIINLILELKKRGHEVPYWVGTGAGDRSAIPDTVYHEHYAAWAGNPALGVDINEFPPPGKELIEKMYKTESIILTMMNKKFDALGVDERRHIYYNMLRYWQGVLKKYKPEAVVFSTIPHTVYDYVIFELAKILNIKTIMFAETGILDRCIMYENWQEEAKKYAEGLGQTVGRNF